MEVEACPRRRCPLGERKGAAIHFYMLSSIVPIISLIPLNIVGPRVGSFPPPIYAIQISSHASFVIILGERIGIN